MLALSFVILLSFGAVACNETGGSSDTALRPASAVTTAAADTVEAAQVTELAATDNTPSAVSASVVHVRVKGVTVGPFYGREQYEGVGSGIVYTSDGHILGAVEGSRSHASIGVDGTALGHDVSTVCTAGGHTRSAA
jgi:hypothetical protein